MAATSDQHVDAIPRRRSQFFKRYNGEFALFVVPTLILFSVFFLIPFFSGAYLSFTKWNGISDNPAFVGFENYVKAITRDTRFWGSFVNTLKYTLGTVVGTNVLALVLAIILTRGLAGQNAMRAAFFIPNVIALIIVGQIWRFLYTQAAGEIAMATGLSFLDPGWLSNGDLAIWSVSLATIWNQAGWFMLVYIAGFESIPQSIIEASTLDGATGIRKYWYVIFPNLIPAFTVCIFLTLVKALRVFAIVYIMTGGGPGHATSTAILDIYNTTFNSLQYGYGTAKSMILLVFIVIVTTSQVVFFKRREVSY
jgi:raffinose/stachyose/melibiose transport system permease protein